MREYIVVTWPESQSYMENKDSVLLNEDFLREKYGEQAYLVPVDIIDAPAEEIQRKVMMRSKMFCEILDSNRVMREALEFYSEQDNYRNHVSDDMSVIMYDKGKKAREVLREAYNDDR